MTATTERDATERTPPTGPPAPGPGAAERAGEHAAPAPPVLPPLGGGPYHELRVHGVAGTSPESMLGMQARLCASDVRGDLDSAIGAGDAAQPGDCGPVAQPGDITVWRAPHLRRHLRAWSWSSLTSGHWYQAFYLVLLPFMIANVAGWMLLSDRCPPADTPARADAGERGRWACAEYRTPLVRVSTLLTRLVALLVTVVFVVSMQLVLADLVTWQWLYHDVVQRHWVVGLGTVATAAALLGVVALTRIRQRADRGEDPWRDHRDPVGLGFLHHRQSLLWDSPGINVTLRRLHLSAGLATIALLAAWPAGELAEPWSTVRLLALATAVGGAVLVVGVLAAISVGDGTRGLARLMAFTRYGAWVLPALAVALAALAPLGLTSDAATAPAALPALRGAALWVALGALAGVVALVVCGVLARRSWQALNAPALLLLAAAIGAAFGAGLANQVARYVWRGCPVADTPGCPVVGAQVNWLAVGVTTSLAVLVVVATARVAVLLATGRGRTLAAHLTRRGTWIAALLGGVGTLLAATGIGIQLLRPGGLPPTSALPPVLGWVIALCVVVPPAILVLVVALRAAWTVADSDGSGVQRRTATVLGLRALRVGGIAVVVAGLGVALAHGWTVTVFGVTLPPPGFTAFAIDVAVVLPTAAALTRIYSGLTNRATRRGVGVLWDVGTFWPRWFHPLAPPTYSDRAVTQLKDQLDVDLDGARHDLLLAPHSQGAVIAATALLRGDRRPRLAMLSYGSPWQRLYAEFFPTQVNAETTAAVAARLSGDGALRWINLHRDTDPIGGPIPAVPLGTALPDPCHRMHSDYWAEPAYRAAAHALHAVLPARAAGRVDGGRDGVAVSPPAGACR